METSETLNELATALAKAQGQLEGAKKQNLNPAFRSKYADLASVWDACRDALSKNGLSVVQAPSAVRTDDGGWAVELDTRLLHTSGQWVENTLVVPVGKPDAQGVGSALTYARRYALSAFVGIAPEDDDGNAAVQTAPPAPVVVPEGFGEWFTDIQAVAGDGHEALVKVWKKSDPDFRSHTLAQHAKAWDAIKAKAKAVKA
jgi:hypothetical protein